jgi:hypothetical protein
MSTRPRDGRKAPKYGMNMRPDLSRGLEVYVDASFAGDWNQTWSEEPTSVLSRTGFMIKYANCPIVLTSKLQTEITLSTTESEYVALSHAMREAIPMMDLLNKIKESIRILGHDKAEFKCKVFEDNEGCIELAKCPRIRPRTKHIAIKYHHFRSKVLDGSVDISPISTDDQQADIFTKNLPKKKFLDMRMLICGW